MKRSHFWSAVGVAMLIGVVIDFARDKVDGWTYLDLGLILLAALFAYRGLLAERIEAAEKQHFVSIVKMDTSPIVGEKQIETIRKLVERDTFWRLNR